jgi:hypothetical protein
VASVTAVKLALRLAALDNCAGVLRVLLPNGASQALPFSVTLSKPSVTVAPGAAWAGCLPPACTRTECVRVRNAGPVHARVWVRCMWAGPSDCVAPVTFRVMLVGADGDGDRELPDLDCMAPGNTFDIGPGADVMLKVVVQAGQADALGTGPRFAFMVLVTCVNEPCLALDRSLHPLSVFSSFVYGEVAVVDVGGPTTSPAVSFGPFPAQTSPAIPLPADLCTATMLGALRAMADDGRGAPAAPPVLQCAMEAGLLPLTFVSGYRLHEARFATPEAALALLSALASQVVPPPASAGSPLMRAPSGGVSVVRWASSASPGRPVEAPTRAAASEAGKSNSARLPAPVLLQGCDPSAMDVATVALEEGASVANSFQLPHETEAAARERVAEAIRDGRYACIVAALLAWSCTVSPGLGAGVDFVAAVACSSDETRSSCALLAAARPLQLAARLKSPDALRLFNFAIKHVADGVMEAPASPHAASRVSTASLEAALSRAVQAIDARTAIWPDLESLLSLVSLCVGAEPFSARAALHVAAGVSVKRDRGLNRHLAAFLDNPQAAPSALGLLLAMGTQEAWDVMAAARTVSDAASIRAVVLALGERLSGTYAPWLADFAVSLCEGGDRAWHEVLTRAGLGGIVPLVLALQRPGAVSGSQSSLCVPLVRLVCLLAVRAMGSSPVVVRAVGIVSGHLMKADKHYARAQARTVAREVLASTSLSSTQCDGVAPILGRLYGATVQAVEEHNIGAALEALLDFLLASDPVQAPGPKQGVSDALTHCKSFFVSLGIDRLQEAVSSHHRRRSSVGVTAVGGRAGAAPGGGGGVSPTVGRGIARTTSALERVEAANMLAAALSPAWRSNPIREFVDSGLRAYVQSPSVATACLALQAAVSGPEQKVCLSAVATLASPDLSPIQLLAALAELGPPCAPTADMRLVLALHQGDGRANVAVEMSAVRHEAIARVLGSLHRLSQQSRVLAIAVVDGQLGDVTSNLRDLLITGGELLGINTDVSFPAVIAWLVSTVVVLCEAPTAASGVLAASCAALAACSLVGGMDMHLSSELDCDESWCGVTISADAGISVGGRTCDATDGRGVVSANAIASVSAGAGSGTIQALSVLAPGATDVWWPFPTAEGYSPRGFRGASPSVVARSEVCSTWQRRLETLLTEVEGRLHDAQRAVHLGRLDTATYVPRLKDDDVKVQDLMACIPRLQAAGAKWPDAFFALCRLAQTGGAVEESRQDGGPSCLGRVLGSGVNILRLIVGIRMRVGFLVHTSQRSSLLEMEEAAVRAALALLPQRGDGRLARELRLLGVGDGDRAGVGQGFSLPSSLFKSRGSSAADVAEDRFAHTRERLLRHDYALPLALIEELEGGRSAPDVVQAAGNEDATVSWEDEVVQLSPEDFGLLQRGAPAVSRLRRRSSIRTRVSVGKKDLKALHHRLARGVSSVARDLRVSAELRKGLRSSAGSKGEATPSLMPLLEAGEGEGDEGVHNFAPSLETVREILSKVLEPVVSVCGSCCFRWCEAALIAFVLCAVFK